MRYPVSRAMALIHAMALKRGTLILYTHHNGEMYTVYQYSFITTEKYMQQIYWMYNLISIGKVGELRCYLTGTRHFML